MRKLLLFAALALPLAACDETYMAVNGTDQVLVEDAGDKIDQRNITEACKAKGMRVVKIAWVGNGRTAALVDCG